MPRLTASAAVHRYTWLEKKAWAPNFGVGSGTPFLVGVGLKFLPIPVVSDLLMVVGALNFIDKGLSREEVYLKVDMVDMGEEYPGWNPDF